ncbi:MAG: hypothetical protein JNL75_08650 [Chitinophagales bacterium]|nr:hypothetical protein [Chitinophagales bacterium]
MKRTIILMAGLSLMMTTSCNQEPKMPTDEEIAQKVQDKYGAELNTLKELKKMQCDESINQQVSERLAASQTPAPATK